MKVRFFVSTFCFFLSPPWKENYDEKDKKKKKQEEKPVIYIDRPSKNLVKFRKYMVKSRNVCKKLFYSPSYLIICRFLSFPYWGK